MLSLCTRQYSRTYSRLYISFGRRLTAAAAAAECYRRGNKTRHHAVSLDRGPDNSPTATRHFTDNLRQRPEALVV